MDFVALVLLVLPAWVANSIPVVFGGGTSIDGGRLAWDERPWLGKGKTWKGAFSGIVFGVAAGAIVAALFGAYYLENASIEAKLFVAGGLSVGAIAGDLLGSFFKRRMSTPSGQQSIVLDQMFFLVAALLVAEVLEPGLLGYVGFQGFVFLAALTFVLHALFNVIAHRLKLKKVPW